jgi:hypothetical protein
VSGVANAEFQISADWASIACYFWFILMIKASQMASQVSMEGQ